MKKRDSVQKHEKTKTVSNEKGRNPAELDSAFRDLIKHEQYICCSVARSEDEKDTYQ